MVQLAEDRRRIIQQFVRVADFANNAVFEDDHLVVVDDCLELVCYGDNGVLGKFATDDALYEGVGNVVDTTINIGQSGAGILRMECCLPACSFIEDQD